MTERRGPKPPSATSSPGSSRPFERSTSHAASAKRPGGRARRARERRHAQAEHPLVVEAEFVGLDRRRGARTIRPARAGHRHLDGAAHVASAWRAGRSPAVSCSGAWAAESPATVTCTWPPSVDHGCEPATSPATPMLRGTAPSGRAIVSGARVDAATERRRLQVGDHDDLARAATRWRAPRPRPARRAPRSRRVGGRLQVAQRRAQRGRIAASRRRRRP